MIEIFELIVEKLQEINKIKWIDLDKGQLDYIEHRAPVHFPCVLIGMQITRTRKISNLRQQCDLMVTIRLAVDFAGNTSQITPGPVRQDSLEYLALGDLIYDQLQGWGTDLFNPMERQSLREERRNDGIKVISIPFTTSFIQDKNT